MIISGKTKLLHQNDFIPILPDTARKLYILNQSKERILQHTLICKLCVDERLAAEQCRTNWNLFFLYHPVAISSDDVLKFWRDTFQNEQFNQAQVPQVAMQLFFIDCLSQCLPSHL